MSDNSSSKSQPNPSNQHNQGGLIAFLFSMVFVFSFMFYLVVIDKGVDLDEKVVDPATQTGPQEQQLDITKVAEPWVESPEIIAYGKKVFSANCTLCHGPAGKGDGPGGQGLNPRPRNLVEGKWTQGSGLTDHFKVVSNGLPNNSPMIGFKNQIKVADRWALVHYINSITENKSKETPVQVAEFVKSYKD